jgi:TetR/AcrR family transcriptional regulator, cholesterol catabolism regulator
MENKLKKSLKIGKAAVKLFNRKGYLQTNMEDIAAAAKMSKGAMYYYFSSKDEILYFVLSNYMDLILHDLESGLQKIKEASSRIQFIISRHIDLYTTNLAEAKTLLHEVHCLPHKYYKTIAAKEREYYRIIGNVIAEFLGGQTSINKAKITSLTFLLLGMCNWIYWWYDPKGDVASEDLSEIIWTVFLKGLNEFKG